MADERVFFDATASEAGNGRRMAGYSWNVGDGTSRDGGVSASQRDMDAGTHDVQLTVTNTLGETDTVSQDVAVGVITDPGS